MALGMQNIAQMLARSGGMLGQQIGAPVSAFGQSVGQNLAELPQQIRQKSLQEQGRSELAQYKDDPVKLTELAAKYKLEGQDALAEAFTTAAEVARQAKLRTANSASISAVSQRDPEALLKAAQQANAAGDVAGAMELTKQAMEIRQEKAARKDLAARAESLGLTSVAKSAREAATTEELAEIRKAIRTEEIKRLPRSNPQVRRNLAQSAGISPKQFNAMGLEKVSEEEFTAIIEGQKGDTKAWMNADNEVKVYRENDYGMVYDDESGKWTTPSDLGLTKAPPQVQKVETIASGMADELAKVGAKNFADLAEGAQKAADTIVSIDRSLPKVENMFSGTGANLKLNVAKLGRAFGIDLADPDSVSDTETYVADSAKRVAEYITNLGAGTGLSDKDREFAEKVVGGDITLDKDTLHRLLKDLRKGAMNKIDRYNSTRTRLEGELGENADASLAFFPEVISIGSKEDTEPTTTVNWSDL